MQTTRGKTINTVEEKLWSRRTSITVVLVVALVATVLDQATKAAAVAMLTPGQPQPVLGWLLQLRLVRNPGAAFSLGENSTWVFTILAIVVLGIIFSYFVPRVRHKAWSVCIGLLVAGILGNLLDRLFRPPAPFLGYVVDFLELPHWPIFNVADMCIVCSAILLVWLSLFGKLGYDGKPQEKKIAPVEKITDSNNHSASEEKTVKGSD